MHTFCFRDLLNGLTDNTADDIYLHLAAEELDTFIPHSLQGQAIVVDIQTNSVDPDKRSSLIWVHTV